jgi:type VI secretion system ImpB/VipA family protein
VKIVESLQHKLDRIRKPRVQITYDVEIGNAIEKKELAFVVGILSDLSGHREDDIRPLPPVKKRKFVEIDRDNFGHVMEAIKPHLHLVVPNHLDTKEAERGFDFYFTSLDDFNPLNLVKHDDALKALYDKRTELKDFLVKLDGNEPLEELVRQIITDPKARADLKTQVAAEIDKIQKAKANIVTPAKVTTAGAAPTTQKPTTPKLTGGK